VLLAGDCQGWPANVDETGWRQNRRRGLLWAVVTRAATVFRVALSRAGSVARELIDPLAGQVFTTDRVSGPISSTCHCIRSRSVMPTSRQ
jgi:hypothetical protein